MSKKKSSKNKKSISSLFPSQQKYRDNLKLLVTDKKFQERVKEIRKYIELPENGLDTEVPNCNELSEAWHGEFYRRSDEMMASPEFSLELEKYKNLFDTQKISYQEHKNLRDTLHQKIPLNYFTRQCENLTVEFNIPLNCAHSIQRFILFNRLDFSPMTPFVISTGSSKDRHENWVALTFFAKITEADLISVKTR